MALFAHLPVGFCIVLPFDSIPHPVISVFHKLVFQKVAAYSWPLQFGAEWSSIMTRRTGFKLAGWGGGKRTTFHQPCFQLYLSNMVLLRNAPTAMEESKGKKGQRK